MSITNYNKKAYILKNTELDILKALGYIIDGDPRGEKKKGSNE